MRLGLLAIVLLAALGCQRPGAGEAAGFGGTGRTETPFESAQSGVEVSLAVTLEKGTAELTILDPSGVVRFQRWVEPASPVRTTLYLPGGPGRWVAVLTYVDAQGSRSVAWTEGR